jgi:thymidylate synthase
MSHNSAKIFREVLCPLYDKLPENSNDITTVYGTVNTVEIVNCNIRGLDPHNHFLDFGDILVANREYIQKELDWYLKATRSVEDMKDIKIWASIADEDGNIHSNYGYRIFHEDNDNQYDKAVASLKADPSTRQSVCIYTYPHIQTDFNAKGCKDFICTFSTQHMIRNGKLIYIVNMRSNDAIYGLRNDFAWHCYVCNRMEKDLIAAGVDVKGSEIQWNAGSMHIYEARSGWDKLRSIVEAYSAEYR